MVKQTAAVIEKRAARQAALGETGRQLAKVAKIKELMSAFPSIVDNLLKKAMALAEDATEQDEQQTSAKPKSDKTLDEQTIRDKAIERHQWCLEKLAVPDIKFMLGLINPYTFHADALQALKEKKQQKEVPKKRLLELLEFVSGVGEHCLTGKSQFPKVGNVVDYVVGRAKRIHDMDPPQNRSSSLPFPPNWQTHGLFIIDHRDADSIGITHRFSGRTCRLTPAVWSWQDPAKVHVLHNFSPERGN
eukprot:73907-Amphidinium_carterae.1